MNILTQEEIQEVERRVPVWAKILTLSLSLLAGGWAAKDFLQEQEDFGPRLELVESHAERAEPILKYLTCQELAENTSACIFILRDSPYLEEFQILGILPEDLIN